MQPNGWEGKNPPTLLYFDIVDRVTGNQENVATEKKHWCGTWKTGNRANRTIRLSY